MATFKISGKAIDPKTRKGIARLRIEVWDKDLIYHDLVGSAITDSEGAFQIQFDESYFQDIFEDRRPDLFFKIFHQDKQIGSTERSVLWNVAAGETEVSLPVEIDTHPSYNDDRGGKPMTRHGQLYLRDIVPPRSKYFAKGKFGRLFPTLPPFLPDTEKVRNALLTLGQPGGIMDGKDQPPPAENPNNPENPNILAGFTFFGQFIDHDLTFDPTSSLERQNDPESIENFRTPIFELDSVYGSGPDASPHLYDRLPQNRGKLLLDEGFPNDLPRNSQNTALIGDPRNDENLIVSQLHLAFIKFHNAVIDKLKAEGSTEPSQIFHEAQRLVRWHYQWIVLHEFLPLTVGQALVDDILTKGRQFYNWRNEPFIPVEFSVAAYRFGHSQVRPGYRVNENFAASIFNVSAHQPPNDPNDPNDLSGGKRAPRRFVEWKNFFNTGEGTPTQSKAIDTKLSSPLFQLPFVAPNMPNNPASLAQRNLFRHFTFSLPSGQAIAKAMCIEPLSGEELADVAELGLDKNTPLWFYILREAENRAEGKTLGPVGGRIVAEVFIGILEGDRMSFLNADPQWKPTLGEKEGEFTIVDLLKFAGVA